MCAQGQQQHSISVRRSAEGRPDGSLYILKWATRLLQDLSHLDDRARRGAGRLDHHRVPRGQGHRDLLVGDEQRVVPRGDEAAHPERHLRCKGRRRRRRRRQRLSWASVIAGGSGAVDQRRVVVAGVGNGDEETGWCVFFSVSHSSSGRRALATVSRMHQTSQLVASVNAAGEGEGKGGAMVAALPDGRRRGGRRPKRAGGCPRWSGTAPRGTRTFRAVRERARKDAKRSNDGTAKHGYAHASMTTWCLVDDPTAALASCLHL